MQIKEKIKNKPKLNNNNNNKLPLPKIKYSNSKNPTSSKIKPINNQPLINFSNINNLDQFNMIQSNMNPSKEQKQKEEHKFNPKTNLKIKNVYDPKSTHRIYNMKNTENKNIISQNNFRYLLKEFGLSEYIRKLYEFGYDNNNYLKIGTLSRRNFNTLLNNIHIFPGHMVKMEKFYEYLRRLNNNHSNNMNNTLYKKRKLNYNSIYGVNNGNGNKNHQNNYNHYYNYDSYNINKQSLNVNNNNKNKKCLSPKNRPKTSHVNGFSKPKIRIRNNYSGNKIKKKKIEEYSKTPFLLNNSIENNNNALIKSYLNDNHKFILNHKLNYNKNLLELQNKYNDIEFFNNNINIKNYNSNDRRNILYDSPNNNNAEKQREIEDKINENIERMLNYYMIQLNDKLDKSYETVEDSSLSYIITSQINESQNINNMNNTKINENKKVLPNYKLPSINNYEPTTNKKDDNTSNIIKLKNKFNDNIKNKGINDNNKEKEKENNNKNNIIEEKEKEKEKENEKEKEKEKENEKEKEKENEKEKEKEKEKEITNNNNITSPVQALNKSKEEKKESTKELTEEELKKEVIKLKEEYIKDIKKFSDHETSTKSKDSKEQQQEEIEEDEFLIKDKKQQPQVIKIENHPINLKEREKKDKIKEQENRIILDDSYLLNEKYSLEQNIYETLRLNRSMDAENINKDSLKFDIEFMCRCLGLALMKLIEQGKEKQHITELYTSEQNQDLKFTFFNKDFNNNISLLKDFFNNKENNKVKFGDLHMMSVLEKFCLDNGDVDNDDIDMMKHIKKSEDEKIILKDDIYEDTFKIRTGLADIDNEFKFIGEFFSYGRKKSKNYQNVSENTKKILCKDLSYIKEIDSELNKTASVANNTDNNNSKISKSNNNSKVNKIEDNSEYNISKTDSKNYQENKTKIIGEDEKDEEYNNYEDEFLNDDNIEDINKNEEKENIRKDDNNKDDNNKKEEKDNIENNLNNKDDNKNEIENKENNNDKNNKDDLNIKNNEHNENNMNENKDKDKDKLNNNEIIKEIKNEKNEETKLNINENNQINEIKEIDTKIDIYGKSLSSIQSIENNKFLSSIKKVENEIETDYIIDADNINKFKEYLLKQFEVFDDDFLYYSMNIPAKRFMPQPDPQSIFEFCANIMILTKMEKEVIINSLIYIERLIFNTGFIINSRNWRKIIFISLIIASKIWDDDSLENIHYSQVFTHLKIGEINLLERTFLELINYKVFVKFSQYIKYYMEIKNLALKYNFNGEQIVPVSVENMMKVQEYAYQMQKRMRKKISLNNSAHL